MRVIRFMSRKELLKYLRGEELVNNKEHTGRTNSIGFCFLKYKNGDEYYYQQFLSGVVSDEVAVVFNTKKKLKKSYGIYADPYGNFFDTIEIDEYSTTRYSKEDMEIEKISIDIIDDLWEGKEAKWIIAKK